MRHHRVAGHKPEPVALGDGGEDEHGLHGGEAVVEVLANYLAGVKLNMIIWWLDEGLPYPPEQMAAMCSRLVLEGAGGMLATAATGV